MQNLFKALAVAAALAGAASAARADTITSWTGPASAGAIGTTIVSGQSVTTPSGVGGWNNITFNFYVGDGTSDGGAATATTGYLYILTAVTPYTGTPAQLSTSTSGFVARALGNGSVWAFDSSVELLPDTQYIFLAADPEGVGIANSTAPAGGYTGGGRYRSTGVNNGFTSNGDDILFNLSGTPNPGPVPGSGLASFAFLGLGWIAMRLHRRREAMHAGG